MGIESLAALRTAAGLEALAAAAEVADGDPLVASTALRNRGIDPALAAAALTQARLRRQAVNKFGPDAARMFFTREGLEQATRGEVATRRAHRLAESGVTRLADLGCGVGADAIACARAGITVVACDADGLTAAIASANAEALGLDIQVVHARAEDADLFSVDAAFCDPARRRASGRVFDPRSFSPPWEFVMSLIDTVPRAVIKLAPGIDHALIPEGAEAEWVSVEGDVVEAAFWCGRLARVPRRASLLGRHEAKIQHAGTAGSSASQLATSAGELATSASRPAASASPSATSVSPSATSAASSSPTPIGASTTAIAATPPAAPPTTLLRSAFDRPTVELTGSGTNEARVGPVRRYVYDPDGAVLRAHLVAEFAEMVGGTLGDPTIAYVYSDQATSTPFARCYEIIDTMPFSLKRLRATLRERGIGRATIKKRGSAIEPEQLRRDLKLAGNGEITIVVTRVAGALTVLLCQPVISPPTASRNLTAHGRP